MKIIIIDTNIIVRLLVRDNLSQFEQAKQIINDIEKGNSKGNISLLVIHELIWILEHYYKIKRTIFIPQILKLLSLRNIKIIEIDKSALTHVLKDFQSHTIDFTDIYLLYMVKTIHKSTLTTFDKDIQ